MCCNSKIMKMTEESDFKIFIERFAYAKSTNKDKKRIISSTKTRIETTHKVPYSRQTKKGESPKRLESRDKYPLDHALPDVIDHNLLGTSTFTNMFYCY